MYNSAICFQREGWWGKKADRQEYPAVTTGWESSGGVQKSGGEKPGPHVQRDETAGKSMVKDG